jgi:hypothetical protein
MSGISKEKDIAYIHCVDPGVPYTMKIADILGTRPEIINDKELMEGLKRSKRDVEEGMVYELKNVDDFDEIWKWK